MLLTPRNWGSEELNDAPKALQHSEATELLARCSGAGACCSVAPQPCSLRLSIPSPASVHLHVLHSSAISPMWGLTNWLPTRPWAWGLADSLSPRTTCRHPGCSATRTPTSASRLSSLRNSRFFQAPGLEFPWGSWVLMALHLLALALWLQSDPVPTLCPPFAHPHTRPFTPSPFLFLLSAHPQPSGCSLGSPPPPSPSVPAGSGGSFSC